MRASGPRSQRLVDPWEPVGEGVFLRCMVALAAPGDAQFATVQNRIDVGLEPVVEFAA